MRDMGIRSFSEYAQIMKQKGKSKRITDTIAEFFAGCTNDLEVRELEDTLTDIIEQERDNRLYELRES